jgi:methylenetetrahydrofolate reductase (NADPH)
MTCTNMNVEDLKDKILLAKKSGINNILCLRGDPPKGEEKWKSTEGGFNHASDLVTFLKDNYEDYFGLSCACYPEGHPDGGYEEDLKYLKIKEKGGADFAITQLFYDTDLFLKFVKDARNMGIKIPIIPGIMPIQQYGSFCRMTSFCKTTVPKDILENLEKIQVKIYFLIF